VRLSRECQERLNQAERRIEILLRDSEGKPAARTFAADEKSDPAEDLEANGDDPF